MKHIKHLFFIALLLLCFTAANAHDFEAGGIYYNITDATNKTVEVTYAGTNYDSHEEYSGNIDIPKSVIYNDTRYSVTSIGENAFRYCPGVKSITIPGSITSIRGYAFYDCTGLTSITIPNSITSIEGFAFYGCTGINYIYIEDGTETLSVGCNEEYDGYARRGLFYNCPLDSVYLGRNLSYSYSNSTFNYSPFKDNTTLKRITLPDDMTSVNGGMFSGCTGLTSIELPYGVTVIGSGSFAGCTGLTSIELPYGVTVIESSSFSRCTGLTDITIPNSVTTIEEYAFSKCVNLTSITIPNSVTVIEHYTFSGCKGLKHIYLEDGTDELSFGKTSYNLGDELVDCPLETVYFGRNLNRRWTPFRGNKTLKSITIGSKVTTINYQEFYNCKGLTAITMANSVTSIGESAFSGCESITSITIPNSVTSIGKSAFSGCSGLTSVTIGNGVTSIGKSAFYGCESLTNIIIPNSVTDIEDYAFRGCSGLTSVTIGNGVTSIGKSAFYGCSGLTSVTIGNGVTSIGGYAFYGCESLTNIIIPNSVTDIEDYAFRGCSGLKHIIFEDGTEELLLNKNTYSGFYDCPLDTVYLGRNLSYKTYPFKDKRTLKSIIIGNNVNKIGENEFNGCTGLESVTIGNSVTVIGKFAFGNCENVTEIVCHALVPPVCDTKALADIDKQNCSLTVPYKSAYKAAEQWKDFLNIKGTYTEKFTVTFIVDGEVYDTLSVEYGEKITLPETPVKEGHTFSGWSEVPETMPAEDITIEGTFSVNSYTITYKVDGEVYATDSIAYGSEIVLRDEPVKEGHTFSGWSEAPETMPAEDITIEGTFSVNSYTITYKVDGEVYATDSVAYGSEIVLRDEPVKEGHTFSGWSEAPETMPAEDITIEGTFSANSYTITYKVDGEVYATDSIAYGSEIVLRDEPVKEGHTFSGWSEAPATMPAEDITITGSFEVNTYAVTYIVDGEVYATDSVAYGSEIVLRDEPTKEGHTFSGWSEAPETMPAEDITIEGTFSVNSYTITYKVDGEVYATDSIAYGSEIVLRDEPVKEGHTFSGWSEAPATMPAEDITITGSFEVNTYAVTYIVDGEVYATDSVAYGSEIVLRDEPTKEGHTFSGWSEAPETMPAEDITIEGTFSVNSYTITYKVDGEVYATDSIAYGSEIVLRDEPTKEGHTFSGWSEAPETMPAEDITIEGTFSVNSYTITYKVDGEVYETVTAEYGTAIELIEEPIKEGHTFSGWSDVPETMPAEDITVEGTFSINSYTVTFIIDGEVYETTTVEFGAKIELPTPPEKEGYIFSGWVGVPDTMPAEDIVIEGEYIVDTTGINDVKAENGKVKGVYDLQGRKVDNPTNGIYIINGKKTLIK